MGEIDISSKIALNRGQAKWETAEFFNFQDQKKANFKQTTENTLESREIRRKDQISRFPKSIFSSFRPKHIIKQVSGSLRTWL